MAQATYFPPTFEQKQFHCVFCGVYAAQRWETLYESEATGSVRSFIKRCACTHCSRRSYWTKDRMLIPGSSTAEPPHPDLPEDCRATYEEARDLAGRSPRAAAALLRLCVQQLMPHLGEKGRNINDDIGALVAKGLPVVVQQAFDVCRVVGNNAVHPGEINLNESPDVATVLFQMINLIVEDRIARPRAVQAAYDQLPEGARKQIEKRDGDVRPADA